jgi:tape measure domain-containing protein
MAINIKFTAQEIEVINSLKKQGEATAALVQKNIELAQSYSRADAEGKFWSRGLERQRKEMAFFKKDVSDVASTLIGMQSGALGGLGGAVGGLGGAAIGAGLDGLLAVGKEISATTERYNRLQIALDTATGSTIKGAEAFSFVTSLARQTGLRIDDLADSYKGFSAASRGTKLEGKETERIFTSIVKAGSAMMLSNEQVKGSLLAVSQMMSKGNVQAEELRGQLSERLPGAFNILAQEMGVTTAQLNDLLKAGAVLSEDALPKLAQGLDKISKDSYAKNLETTTGAMNNLRNEVDLMLTSFGRESNINGFFASILNGAASVVRGGYLERIADSVLRISPVGIVYNAFDAKSRYDKGQDKYRKITKVEAIKEASGASLTSQKKRLDVDYNRMKFLDKAADPNNNIAANSQQLESYKREREAIRVNYTLRKQAYEGEITQRQTAKKAAQEKLGLGAKELTQLKDINKEIDKNRTLLNDLKKKDPTGFTRSKEGIALMEKIGRLNKEKADLEAFGKLGKPSTGESEFEKQLRKENKAGEDLFKVRLAMIKQARLDAELIANNPAAFSNSPIGSPSQVFGKGVATIQTGGGSELLANAIQQDRLDKMVSVVRRKMLDKIEGLVYDINTGLTKEVIDLSKIKIKPVEPQFINDFDKSVKGSVQAIEKYFTDLGGVWEANAAIFGDIVGNGIGSALQNGFAGLGTAIAQGENPFKAFGEGLVHAFGDMLLQAGQIMLAQAGLMLGASILSGGALSPFFAKTAATGAALTTAGAAIKAVKFADGGIVSGPTFSMTGEYRGAKNNPEVIAPLSKLGNLFTPYFQRAVNMGRYNSPQLATQAINTQTNVYFGNKVLLTQIDKAIVKRGRI